MDELWRLAVSDFILLVLYLLGMVDVVVIGGGAAGIFAAIHASERGANVVVLEKSNKLLSKVRISGGGRCNVTHRPMSVNELVKHYPRGGKSLKHLFNQWRCEDTMAWFTERGVPLKIEDDGRVFPVSDDSEDIIAALLKNARNVDIQIKSAVTDIQPNKSGFSITINNDTTIFARRVIAAAGGSPKRSGLQLWEKLGLPVVDPVPSLFTFNIKHAPLNDLMGLSVQEATVYLPEIKQQFSGPVLITHWGLSGPAVLKLSAFAARELAARQYQYNVRVQWIKDITHEEVLQSFNPNKTTTNNRPESIPKRLWHYLMERADVRPDIPFKALSKKEQNRMAEIIINDTYNANGKSTYKEEFVTAGGVALEAINLKTMEAKDIPGLYIVGELADIDGITGGFNFQAAWATGLIAGSHQ